MQTSQTSMQNLVKKNSKLYKKLRAKPKADWTEMQPRMSFRAICGSEKILWRWDFGDASGEADTSCYFEVLEIISINRV